MAEPMADSPHCFPAPAAAGRMAGVLAPVIPRVAALMRQRPDCLSLAQGMVSWGPPPQVATAVQLAMQRAAKEEAAAAALDRYGPVPGDPELLELVHRELRERRGLDSQHSELLVTAGSNMAFHAIAQVICDPGDEVILPVPWYFNHVMAVQLVGGRPVAVDAGMVPDPERLAAAITPRSRAIVTVSPNNPSGVVVPSTVLEAINELCARHGLFHIHDEAYVEFVHDGDPQRSPGCRSGSGAHTITLHSLSKAYGMAGWRIGYASVPSQLMPALAKVQDTVLICPPRLTQVAGRAALEAGPDWCRPRVVELGERRRQLLQTLAAAQHNGLPVRLLAEPQGAFYALVAVATPLGGDAVIERLILRHGVAVLPGESFGMAERGGELALRLSYGMVGGADLQEAMNRLLNGLGAMERG